MFVAVGIIATKLATARSLHAPNSESSSSKVSLILIYSVI